MTGGASPELREEENFKEPMFAVPGSGEGWGITTTIAPTKEMSKCKGLNQDEVYY